jgi:predicted nucleic acid-binding protein
MVPALWPLEVANGLRSAERRGRITIADSARVRELLLSLPIHIEVVDLAAALTEVVDLARTSDLSAYDAAYLALAARRGLPMATADERLAHACTQAGVELVG